MLCCRLDSHAITKSWHLLTLLMMQQSKNKLLIESWTAFILLMDNCDDVWLCEGQFYHLFKQDSSMHCRIGSMNSLFFVPWNYRYHWVLWSFGHMHLFWHQLESIPIMVVVSMYLCQILFQKHVGNMLSQWCIAVQMFLLRWKRWHGSGFLIHFSGACQPFNGKLSA